MKLKANPKTHLALTTIVLLAVAIPTMICAMYDDFNRPIPLMDYVPQQRGMYDTRYDRLSEADCRGCHGGSVADRHHFSPVVLNNSACSFDAGGCHEMIQEPPGVVAIRDCTTSGCHRWDDLGPMDGQAAPPNGWHHDTDLPSLEDCVDCHNPNLIGPISPFCSFQEYPLRW